MIRQFALTIRLALFCLCAAMLWQPASVSAQSPEVRLERQDIRQVQETLNMLGYDAGPADGLMGPQTRSAIEAFRASRGYELDGPIEQSLLDRLAEAQAESSEANDTETTTTETQSTPPPTEEVERSADTPSIDTPAADTPSEEATQPAPAETDQPDAADTTPAGPELIGTRWRFIDDNGATMEATFRSNGRIERQGRVDSDWSWSRQDRSLAIEYNSGIGLTSVREGHLVDPQTMRGTGTSSTGRTWTWEAERLDSGTTSN